jgi:hypothetical protein
MSKDDLPVLDRGLQRMLRFGSGTQWSDALETPAVLPLLAQQRNAMDKTGKRHISCRESQRILAGGMRKLDFTLCFRPNCNR